MTKLKSLIFLVAMIVMTGLSLNSKAQEISTVYLNNTTYGNSLDTINKVTTNDTSYTFSNNTGLSICTVEVVFGTTKYLLKVVDPIARGVNLRVRFLASDSSLYIERAGNPGLGTNRWTPLSFIVRGKNGSGSTGTVGTGTGYVSLTTAVYGASTELSKLQFTDITGTAIIAVRMRSYRQPE